MGIRCRRLVFERVLRGAAAREPGLTLRVGHVDDITVDRGHVTGVRVDGTSLDADLVLVASGRAGRLGQELRARPGTGTAASPTSPASTACTPAPSAGR
jgi:flavin-dependent dehydrogenase